MGEKENQKQEPISLLKLVTIGVSSSVLVVGGLFLLFAAYESQSWFFWTAEEHLAPDTLFGVGRNAVTLAAALGVGVTLFFSYRKQQTAEHAQELAIKAQNMALESQRLATETLQLSLDKHELERISELRNRYARSAEQLANEKDAVQLAGIHSLASLADDWARIGNEDEQQVCISLLCSYIGHSRPPQEKPVDVSIVAAIDIVLSRLTLKAQSSDRFWGERRVAVMNGILQTLPRDMRITGGEITFKTYTPPHPTFERFEIDSGSLNYIGLGETSIPAFDDCQFKGGSVQLRSDSSMEQDNFFFFNCGFTGSAVLIYTEREQRSSIVFDECHFSDGKVWITLGPLITHVAFIRCTFTSPEVIRIHSSRRDEVKLVLRDCKFIGSGTLMQENPEDALMYPRNQGIRPEFFRLV